MSAGQEHCYYCGKSLPPTRNGQTYERRQCSDCKKLYQREYRRNYKIPEEQYQRKLAYNRQYNRKKHLQERQDREVKTRKRKPEPFHADPALTGNEPCLRGCPFYHRCKLPEAVAVVEPCQAEGLLYRKWRAWALHVGIIQNTKGESCTPGISTTPF